MSVPSRQQVALSSCPLILPLPTSQTPQQWPMPFIWENIMSLNHYSTLHPEPQNRYQSPTNCTSTPFLLISSALWAI
eukprot:13149369-Ditylum_brightwellii.AAC.1